MSCASRVLPPVVVAFVRGGEGTSDLVLRSVWLKIPSAKLLAHLTFTGVPDDGSPGVGFAADSHWQITPYVPALNTGGGNRPSPLSPVFVECDGTEDPRPLPGGYEIQSAVRLWQARVTIKPGPYVTVDDNGNTVTSDGLGRYVAACTIEPAPEACLSEAEFNALAGQCELYLDGPPVMLDLAI